MINILSLSGGKDSVALLAWARRTGLNPIPVYLDTVWEWDEPDAEGKTHYRHLDLLEARLGPFIRLTPASAYAAWRSAGMPTPTWAEEWERELPQDSFIEVVRKKGIFPSRVAKWCTEELKIYPFALWLDVFRQITGEDVQVLVGVRAEESAERALMSEREYSKVYDCDVWRPLLNWKLADVMAEHHRAAIPVHPLYRHGAERVGCFPCVNASKAELRLVGELAPKRIQTIREVEAEIGHTMFTEDVRTEKTKVAKALEAQGMSAEEAWEKAGPSVRPIGIDAVMAWANTKRGGKEIQLERPRTGCARWGLCELPRPVQQDLFPQSQSNPQHPR
jgi:3'-phosphoadenosine 5'-phosphosulfate sulfotransferase (PAPS reductase)/FAD synthetase